MKIAIVGTGYVGLVSGACFAEMGHSVICIDTEEDKITNLKNGIIPIFEPGLGEVVSENINAGRLSFTTSLPEAIQGVEAIFIAVGTPTRECDGGADLTYVISVIDEIAEHLNHYAVIVTKSTVPVGTGLILEDRLGDRLSQNLFDVASNPEFLREGAAIEDFMQPDRIVVGINRKKARKVLEKIYEPLTQKGYPLLVTHRESAELIKYASNAFLATKISFINEIANLCEKVGANVTDVARGMGLDSRIGAKFLQAGPGYGGSCFPKDTLALIKTGEDHKVSMQIVKTTVKVNDERKIAMAHKIIDAFGGSVNGKTIAILGLTFKANTDDMRDAPSLVIIPELLKAGALIKAYDPEGMNEAKQALGETIEYCLSMEECLSGTKFVTILTEWDEFGKLTPNHFEGVQEPIVVDLRNVIGKEDFDFLTVVHIGE